MQFLLTFVLAAAQIVAPTNVRLAWEFYPLSRPSNTGWYNIWRAAKVGDYCPGSLTWIGHVQQTFAPDGTPIPPAFIDAAPLHGLACYSISFVQTPSGTPSAVESEQSTPIEVAFP
jgi:hypothetical protein